MTLDDIMNQAYRLSHQSAANADWIKDWNTLEDTLLASPDKSQIINAANAALTQPNTKAQAAACVILSMLD